MIGVAPGQKYGHRRAWQGPNLVGAECRYTLGASGKEILREVKNWVPGPVKGQEREKGPACEKSP